MLKLKLGHTIQNRLLIRTHGKGYIPGDARDRPIQSSDNTEYIGDQSFARAR